MGQIGQIGTNPRLFRLLSQYVLKSDLKKSQICPILGKFTHFGTKYGHSGSTMTYIHEINYSCRSKFYVPPCWRYRMMLFSIQTLLILIPFLCLKSVLIITLFCILYQVFISVNHFINAFTAPLGTVESENRIIKPKIIHVSSSIQTLSL